mmetsp:Transcript_26671/g.47466  ORF Transcript_26671/g.47466 Transcript_26671/m.47466 type:complete len:201 (+) Transcript_26671:381-983(+)
MAEYPRKLPTSTTLFGLRSVIKFCRISPFTGPTSGSRSRCPHRSSRRRIQSSSTSFSFDIRCPSAFTYTSRSPNSICAFRISFRRSTLFSADACSPLNKKTDAARPTAFTAKFGRLPSSPVDDSENILARPKRQAMKHDAPVPPSSTRRSGRGKKYSNGVLGSFNSFSSLRSASTSSEVDKSRRPPLARQLRLRGLVIRS